MKEKKPTTLERVIILLIAAGLLTGLIGGLTGALDLINGDTVPTLIVWAVSSVLGALSLHLVDLLERGDFKQKHITTQDSNSRNSSNRNNQAGTTGTPPSSDVYLEQDGQLYRVFIASQPVAYFSENSHAVISELDYKRAEKLQRFISYQAEKFLQDEPSYYGSLIRMSRQLENLVSTLR